MYRARRTSGSVKAGLSRVLPTRRPIVSAVMPGECQCSHSCVVLEEERVSGYLRVGAAIRPGSAFSLMNWAGLEVCR